MTKFKVGDKVVAIEDLSTFGFPKGEIVPIVGIYGNQTTIRVRNASGFEDTFFCERFELAESTSSENQRITKLESEIAELLPLKEEVKELKLIVHQLRKPSTGDEEVSASSVEDTIEYEGQQYKKVDREACEGDVVALTGDSLPPWFTKGNVYKINENGLIDRCDDDTGSYPVYEIRYGRTPETVDVYELIPSVQAPTTESVAEWDAKPKSPNQLRAEIIEKAKGFVDKHTTYNGKAMAGEGVKLKGGWVCIPEFVVNEKKRTVVLLFRLVGGKRTVFKRGIAKCNPSDVFNEHIGRAIALGRALGLDVSEFEQAVQPTEFVVGQVVNVFDTAKSVTHVEGELVGVVSQKCLKFKGEDYKKYLGYGFERTSLAGHYNTTIINDTNTIYGEVNE